MASTAKAIKEIVTEQLMPAFRKERERLDEIDKWLRWDHDAPHQPKQSTQEYKELQGRAQAPWGSLVVTSAAQNLYVDGYRQSGESDNAAPWQWWQANGMDGRQVALHRAALGYGHAYVTVTPGKDDFGTKMPVIRGLSPRRMITFYREPEHDDWPHFALRADPAKVNGSIGWALRIYDDKNVHFLNCDAGGSGVTYMEARSHGVGFCPVVRYANQLDLEGRTPGEIEPFIPLFGRIDQTVFDRLVVQRFASWKVRTIAGMAMPEAATQAQVAAEKLRLKVEDILVAEDHDTKFGTLDATELDGFIKAMESDIRVLAAVSQTPAHELLGQLSNLSAEALAAARASLTAKVEERKMPFGESHEQTLRLAAHIMGDKKARSDFSAEVRWRDTEIRSLAQAADALGKIATMLQVPAEALWSKIPGWTDQDLAVAKKLAEKQPAKTVADVV